MKLVWIFLSWILPRSPSWIAGGCLLFEPQNIKHAWQKCWVTAAGIKPPKDGRTVTNSKPLFSWPGIFSVCMHRVSAGCVLANEWKSRTSSSTSCTYFFHCSLWAPIQILLFKEAETLLSKLEYYGVTGTANNLIKSYLVDRSQRVLIKDSYSGTHYSEWNKVKRGVPQGSILGPLFFFCFI